MTITISKRTFVVTSDTKFFKGGKPATLGDGVVGQKVTGSYVKSDDGKLVAKTIYFGGKNGGGASTSTGTNAPGPVNFTAG